MKQAKNSEMLESFEDHYKKIVDPTSKSTANLLPNGKFESPIKQKMWQMWQVAAKAADPKCMIGAQVKIIHPDDTAEHGVQPGDQGVVVWVENEEGFNVCGVCLPNRGEVFAYAFSDLEVISSAPTITEQEDSQSPLNRIKVTVGSSQQQLVEFLIQHKGYSYQVAKAAFNRQLLQVALNVCQGNITKTAEFVGVSRTALRTRIQDLKIRYQANQPYNINPL